MTMLHAYLLGILCTAHIVAMDLPEQEEMRAHAIKRHEGLKQTLIAAAERLAQKSTDAPQDNVEIVTHVIELLIPQKEDQLKVLKKLATGDQSTDFSSLIQGLSEHLSATTSFYATSLMRSDPLYNAQMKKALSGVFQWKNKALTLNLIPLEVVVFKQYFTSIQEQRRVQQELAKMHIERAQEPSWWSSITAWTPWG